MQAIFLHFLTTEVNVFLLLIRIEHILVQQNNKRFSSSNSKNVFFFLISEIPFKILNTGTEKYSYDSSMLNELVDT